MAVTPGRGEGVAVTWRGGASGGFLIFYKGDWGLTEVHSTIILYMQHIPIYILMPYESIKTKNHLKLWFWIIKYVSKLVGGEFTAFSYV